MDPGAIAGPPGPATEVVLSVSEREIALAGAGLRVSAPHHGVKPGLANAVYEVRRVRVRADATRSRSIADDQQAAEMSLRRAGRLLADSFLPPPVAASLAELLRRAAREHTVVRLGVEAGRFGWLPWEALPDPVDQQALALHPSVTVYRKVPAGQPPNWGGPLRIAVAISSPQAAGGRVLDYERELRNVHAAVRDARQRRAEVTLVPFATTTAIRGALEGGGVHVLHLSAHGSPGRLFLEDERGRAQPVDAEAFLDAAMPPEAMPPVVALAACYTDTPAADGVSFASRLAQRGVAAVIATETSVTDLYATRLFARVYRALAQAASPDVVQAVADARRLVQQELTESSDERDRRLARTDEWSVVTVLTSTPTVTVYDPTAPTQAAPPDPTPATLDLPARPTGHVVGRRPEQHSLPANLVPGPVGGAGVVLHGIGGVGKTTLAAELVHHAQAAEPALAMAILSGRMDIDRLLLAFACAARRHLLAAGTGMERITPALDTVEQPRLPWPDRWAVLLDQVLPEVPLLAVVDAFEDNLAPTGDGSYQVTEPSLAELLATVATTPETIRLLVTSRFPFTLPGGAEQRLRFHHLPPLSYAETLKLVWQLPHLDQLDNTQLRTVWQLVGGHPRALEYLDALLAGGAGRYRDLTTRLADAVYDKLGAAEGRAWLARERDLDTAIAETVTMIADDVLLSEHLTRLARTPRAERLLIGASVYRQPVDTSALLYQIDQADADTPDLPTLLAATGPLTVYRDGTVFVHRWAATELARHWSERGRAEQVRHAHRRAAAYWMRQVDLRPQDRHAGMIEIRYHLLQAGDLDDAHDITEDLCDQLHTWGAWDREADLIHDTLAQLPEDHPRRAAWLHQLGMVVYHQGGLDRARQLFRRSLAHFERLGDHTGAATCYHELGMLAHDRGDPDQAEHLYREALAIVERHGKQAGMAVTYGQLGALAHDRGDLMRAEHLYRRALEIDEGLGNDAGIAIAHHQLGLVAYDWRDLDRAEQLFLTSLAINEMLGNQPGAATGYHQLAMVAHDRGNLDDAEELYWKSFAIAERLGDQVGMAVSYHQIGVLAHDRGDLDEAGRLYRLALTIHKRLANQAGAAESYHQLAMVAHDRGDLDQAERLYREGLAINERLGNQAGIATSYHQLGLLAHDRGDLDQAERLYRQSLTSKESRGDQAGMARTYGMLGELCQQRGEPHAAVSMHIRALSILLRLGLPQAADGLDALTALREHLGRDAFLARARALLDDDDCADLEARLDHHLADPR